MIITGIEPTATASSGILPKLAGCVAATIAAELRAPVLLSSNLVFNFWPKSCKQSVGVKSKNNALLRSVLFQHEYVGKELQKITVIFLRD